MSLDESDKNYYILKPMDYFLKKTKGKIRLTSMLRTGRELKVFAVRDGDVKTFCTEARKYGVLFTILKDRDASDGLTDVMVRAEDAGKINRIFERFGLSTVDVGGMRAEVRSVRGERNGGPPKTMTHREKVEEFLDEILGKTFPAELEDWWRYEYEVRESGAVLKLSHIDQFDFGPDGTVTEHTDTTFNLLEVRTKLLTVEEYAQAYGVSVITVRQWIRRGKIRTAVKAGSEWRIPELAECLGRRYGDRTYTRKEYLTDLPEGYAFFNKYDHVTLSQNEDQRDQYIACFVKDYDLSAGESEKEIMRKYYKAIQIGQKEREKFELYLIANPFVEAEEKCFT